MRRNIIFFIMLMVSSASNAQQGSVYGKITNSKLEPLAFASIEVREIKRGTITKEDGTYSLKLDEGKYDLIISMIGYKSQLITVIIGKTRVLKNVILEDENSRGLSEVVIKGRDQAEEIIRNVIRHKDEITAAHGAYSCSMYIKAVQEDSSTGKIKINKADTLGKANADLRKMNLTEVALQYDYESPTRTKEERIGVTRGKKADGLFYLSTTDGNFNFYNNLVKVPAVSEVPILSPVSYSGLLAYKFKTISVKNSNGRKQFVISVKPRALSNATVEGEITIADSSWVILHTQFSFPKYHLPEYDFFEVEQDYHFVNDKAWMITNQQFTYYSKAGRKTLSGNTTVTYKDFLLNKTFDKKYFGAEVSTTAQSAYEKDSSFWQTTRTVPLTQKEVRYIHYKDSIYTATHTNAYLDSMDNVMNKITFKKIFISGLIFNDHYKKRSWYIQPITAFFQPF